MERKHTDSTDMRIQQKRNSTNIRIQQKYGFNFKIQAHGWSIYAAANVLYIDGSVKKKHVKWDNKVKPPTARKERSIVNEIVFTGA